MLFYTKGFSERMCIAMEHIFSVPAKLARYDTVVCGGGLAGVAAALYHLKKNNPNKQHHH